MNSAELLSIGVRCANEHCTKEGKEEKKHETHHDRHSARSNGTLSRNSSGWPLNSFGTGRRSARSLRMFSIPLSGTLGTGLNSRTKTSKDLLRLGDSFSLSHLIRARSASR